MLSDSTLMQAHTADIDMAVSGVTLDALPVPDRILSQPTVLDLESTWFLLEKGHQFIV